MARWIPRQVPTPAGGQAPGSPTFGPAGGQPAQPAQAAASDTEHNQQPSMNACIVALVLIGAGSVVATQLLGTKSGPTYKPAAGIGAFALFYVAAQAIERLVEVLVGLIPDAWTYDKPEALKGLDRAIVAAENGPDEDTSKAAANAKAKLEQVVANRTMVTFGLAAALGTMLCSYFEASFLAALGVKMGTGFGNELITVVVTALVVGGGSKQLHDLITKVSKSNASASAAGG